MGLRVGEGDHLLNLVDSQEASGECNTSSHEVSRSQEIVTLLKEGGISLERNTVSTCKQGTTPLLIPLEWAFLHYTEKRTEA